MPITTESSLSPWSIANHTWEPAEDQADTSSGVYGARPAEGERDGCFEHPNAPVPDDEMACRLRRYQEIVDRGRRIPT